MYRNSYRHRLITLALGTAMTSALLAGCASGGAQPARLAATRWPWELRRSPLSTR